MAKKVKIKSEQEGVPISAELPSNLHAMLMLEKNLSKASGKKKNLPEIIVERLERDIKAHPVIVNGAPVC